MHFSGFIECPCYLGYIQTAIAAACNSILRKCALSYVLIPDKKHVSANKLCEQTEIKLGLLRKLPN